MWKHIERRSGQLEAFTANVANKKQKTENLLLRAQRIRNPIIFNRIVIKSEAGKIQNTVSKNLFWISIFFFMRMTAAGGRYIIVGRSTYRQNYYTEI
jgi:hypothetical protein